MQVLPRWRKVVILKNFVVQSTSMVSSPSSTHLASFHSTPISSEKWKSKWNFVNYDVKQGQQPTKNHVRYEIRQKRADTKRALKDLLFNSGASKITAENFFSRMDETTSWKRADHSDSSDKKSRSKSSARRASKAQNKRMKRKFRQESFSDDFDAHPVPKFQATFGNRWYTWSFIPWEESNNQTTTNGFEWRDHAYWTNKKCREWRNASDIESDDESFASDIKSDVESFVVGSSSERTILGLPPKGPLKIEDVKTAFRLSALKWHPDRHQGSSQAMAEERFKLCVDAYKSLCSALSSA